MDDSGANHTLEILAALGRNLKAARVSAGMSQLELAIRAGIKPRTLAEIESGSTDPDLRLLGTLADVLGCEACDLVDP